MNKLLKLTAVVIVALALVACTTRTEFGECIGAADDKSPALIYRLSAWNIIVGIIFSETIVVPVVVVAAQLMCPEGKK
jgi:hypothetical protein